MTKLNTYLDFNLVIMLLKFHQYQHSVLKIILFYWNIHKKAWDIATKLTKFISFYIFNMLR